jgi:hypothetical protein
MTFRSIFVKGTARQAKSLLPWAMRFISLFGVMVSALTIAGASSAFAADPSSGLTTTGWQQALAQPPGLGRGCYQASYPSLQWQATACNAAPAMPLEPVAVSTPASAAPTLTVGNGTDYSAQVTGTISSATGSFADVSPGITETGQVGGRGAQIANTFSLQLNTEFFSTPACSGSTDPSKCQGWQQFVYLTNVNEVFMQYWLINYDNTCPSDWFSYEDDCYTNSPASVLSDGPITAADLTTTTLTGSASASGKDEVTLSFGGQAVSVTNPGSVLDLAPQWNTTEFDIFGDGGGGEAYFGANTTLEAQTTLSSSSESAPTCVEEGFTAETNNLSLTHTPTIATQVLPTMVSEQTDTSPTTPSCATAPGSSAPTAGPCPHTGNNYSGQNCSYHNFNGAQLSNANFSGANLSGANLSGANLTNADLAGANLSGANLTNANLSGANLTNADSVGANLTNANLTGANLTGTNLDGAITFNVNFSKVRWSNTTCPDGSNSSTNTPKTCVGHGT